MTWKHRSYYLEEAEGVKNKPFIMLGLPSLCFPQTAIHPEKIDCRDLQMIIGRSARIDQPGSKGLFGLNQQ